VQSSRWGIVAGVFTLLLLIVLVGVIWLTLRSQPAIVLRVAPTPAAPGIPAATLAASGASAAPVRPVSSPTPTKGTPASAIPAVAGTPEVPRMTGPTPDATATPAATGTAVQPQTASLRMPTPTPTPASARGPLPGEWSLFTDANEINDLVIVSNTVWLATEGGALAWSLGSRTPVKFTTGAGLGSNRLATVVDCPLPGLGLVFGSANGLHVTDPPAGGWRNLSRAEGSLRFDDVATLLCDKENGRLVVGFARHGIGIFDPESGGWRYLGRSSGLGANEVRGLAIAGRAGPIWVLAPSGITVVAGPDSEFYETGQEPLAAGELGAIAADKAGTIWAGGEGVLYQVVGKTWTRFDGESAPTGEFPAGLITGIEAAEDGLVWLVDDDGAVCRFDPDTTRCQEFYRRAPGMAAGPVTSLALDGAGNPYYATRGNGFSGRSAGLWRTFTKADERVRGNRVGALAPDVAGDLWVATEAGIQRFAEGDLTRPGELFTQAETGLEAQGVRVLYPDPDGGLWAGGTGAAYFDGERWTPLSTVEGLAGEAVQAIAVDEQGRTWFGTDQGLSVWNGAAFFDVADSLELPSNDFRALLVDGDVIWIGTAAGLYRIADNQLQLLTRSNAGLPDDTINALALAPDGVLLVGTARGLAEVRAGVVQPAPEFKDAAIVHIATVGDEVWVAQENGPVFRRVGAVWEAAAPGADISLAAVTALAGRADRVWFGSTGGLVQLAK
jgi:ligand-binding sensor domain-containing protein